jgi:hypothetical protein
MTLIVAPSLEKLLKLWSVLKVHYGPFWEALKKGQTTGILLGPRTKKYLTLKSVKTVKFSTPKKPTTFSPPPLI